MLKRSGPTRSHWSGKKKKWINSVPNEFIGTAVQVQDAIHRRYSKEMSELRQYSEEIERNWKILRDPVLELGVEQQVASKIPPYSLCSVFTRRTYFSPSERDPVVIIKEPAVKRFGVKTW